MSLRIEGFSALRLFELDPWTNQYVGKKELPNVVLWNLHMHNIIYAHTYIYTHEHTHAHRDTHKTVNKILH